MPLLWRPHDHHRDLRAWWCAAISTDRADDRDQDRHLITTIVTAPHQIAVHPCRWSSTGHDGARPNASSGQRFAGQSASFEATRCCETTASSPASSSTVSQNCDRRSPIPHARRSNRPRPSERHGHTYPFPRFPSLEAFRRRPPGCAAPSAIGRHLKPFTKVVIRSCGMSKQPCLHAPACT